MPNEPLASADIQHELASLRVHLLPLLALEATLASELSGGVSITGGRSEAFVRLGWQSLTAPSWAVGTDAKKTEAASRARMTTTLVARTMSEVVDDIEALWLHEAVKFYSQQRRIRLDDSASLCVFHFHFPSFHATFSAPPTNCCFWHIDIHLLEYVTEDLFYIQLPPTYSANRRTRVQPNQWCVSILSHLLV